MKQHFLSIGWLWLVLVFPHLVFGQTYPEPVNFCDDQAEDFCSVNPILPNIPPTPYPSLLDTRYANDVGQDLPSSPSWPNIVGNTICADPYDVSLKLASNDFESTINGEKSAWNKDSDLAFFRNLDEVSLMFFDEQGDQIGSHTFTWQDFYDVNPGSSWRDKLTTIYWHPRENAIFYPREHELIKRTVQTTPSFQVGSAQVEVRFPGYRIGGENGSIKIAGGDGNDVNAGRFLISLERNNKVQYTVYDFRSQKIVDQVVNLSSNPQFQESLYDPTFFQSHLFNLPKAIDYAQVSPTGKYIVFTHKVGQGPLQLFDFSGKVYDIAYNGPGSGLPKDYLFFRAHFEVGFVIAPSPGGDMVRECIIVKAIPASVGDLNGSIGSDPGDMVAVYWYINPGQTEIQWGSLEVMDWSIAPTGDFGGGQYSQVSTLSQPPVGTIFDEIPYSLLADNPFRALVALNTVAFTPGWPPYYGEIVEVSLNYHDLQPRRLIHHRITSQSSPIDQPEAWVSPDGRKMFFKSPENAPSQLEYLYFVPIPLRTCKDHRDLLGSSYRLASASLASTFRLYPNPVTQGSMWLEGSEEIVDGPLLLRFTALDGRQIDLWQGSLVTDLGQKIPLRNVASGMYLSELLDLNSGTVIHRQKVLVR